MRGLGSLGLEPVVLVLGAAGFAWLPDCCRPLDHVQIKTHTDRGENIPSSAVLRRF